MQSRKGVHAAVFLMLCSANVRLKTFGLWPMNLDAHPRILVFKHKFLTYVNLAYIKQT